nr:immunoglobulin heavy chain junction region [Mus musculus]
CARVGDYDGYAMDYW